jgi:hypothetical protein
MTRLKYDYEMLKNICDDGGVTLLIDYSNKYITRDTRIIGKCIFCENSFDKSLNKLHKQRNFGCITCAKDLMFERIKNTMVDKYGVEYAAQSQICMDKMKKTTFEKYGVEYANQSEVVKDKIRQTNLEKYGFEYGLQSEVVKEKTKQTNLKKYGFENPLQREEIKEKSKNTCLKKYGVEYSSQCSEIYEKQNKNSYYLKDYTLPSGNTIKIQGYEHYALDELYKKENSNENDIITGYKNVPTIWYNDNDNKKHRHFVDIFIPSKNKCIEVKSTWTFKKQKEVVFLKQTAAKELGFLYEIWVYDNKGNKVEIYN